MFEEYQVVRLKRDRPSEGLTTKDVGTIVLIYGDAHPIAYEVEFTKESGATLALITLKPEDIEPV